MHWMTIKRRCSEVFARRRRRRWRRRRRRLVKVGGGRLSVRIALPLNGKCRQKPLECRNAIDKVVLQSKPPPHPSPGPLPLPSFCRIHSSITFYL